jgi:hypothetical protein
VGGGGAAMITVGYENVKVNVKLTPFNSSIYIYIYIKDIAHS